MPTTRDVEGSIFHTNGDPWANAVVKFERTDGSYSDEGLYPPDEVTPVVTTSISGFFTATVWADEEGLQVSRYKVTLPNKDVYRVSVPVGNTPITLTELILLDETPVPVLPTVVEAHETAPDPHPQYLLVSETDLVYAPLISPVFSGSPSAPTAASGTNTVQLATTAFVQSAVALLVNASPGTLDTLNELAAALGNDPNFAATTASLIGTKLAKASNLSDLTDVTAARSNLGLVIGTNVQPLDSDLTAIAALSTTAYGRSLLTVADAAAGRTLLGAAAPATTLAGYGITDAYTTAQNNTALALKANLSGGNTLTGAQVLTQATGNALVVDTTVLVVDATNDRVGIGTAFPGDKLDINGGNIRLSDGLGIKWVAGSTQIYGSSTSNTMNFVTNGATRIAIGSTGNVLVNGFTAPTVGLTIKGAASQTGNLQEWQDSTGAVLASLQSNGRFAFGGSGQAVLQPVASGALYLRANSNAVIVGDSGTTNVYVFGSSALAGAGVGVIGVANATTVPTTNPTGGGVLYSEAGAAKWRGSSGTITTIGPAEPHCPVCGRDFALEWKNEQMGELVVCMWCLTDGFTKGIIRKQAA